MKIKTNYHGCEYITAGKEYEAVKRDEAMAIITNDEGEAIGVLMDGTCFHLHNIGKWEVVEESPEIDYESQITALQDENERLSKDLRTLTYLTGKVVLASPAEYQEMLATERHAEILGGDNPLVELKSYLRGEALQEQDK